MIERRLHAGIEFSIAEPAQGMPQHTLVCLHGIGGDDTSFAEQSAVLSADYRVVAWNMPGYRKSQRIEPVSFSALSASLKGLLDEMQWPSVHLVGQSIGGMVAQDYYHRHAADIRSLILIATTSVFGGKDNSFKEAFLAARLKPLDEGVSMATLAANAIPSVVANNITADALQVAIDAMAGLDAQVYRNVLKCLVTFNRREELPAIQCPVCVIAGSQDTNAPAATMAKMAQKLLHASYHEIQGAGHLVNTEMPDQTNRIIHSFIKKNFTDD